MTKIFIGIAVFSLILLLVYGVLISTGILQLFELRTTPGPVEPPSWSFPWINKPPVQLPSIDFPWDTEGSMVPPDGSLPTNPISSDDREVMATIESDTTGRVLLRWSSFGSFNGEGWNTDFSEDPYADRPFYLTSELLYMDYSARIELFCDMPLTPCYSVLPEDPGKGSTYTVRYLTCDVVNSPIGTHEGTKLEKDELAYREFVYDNYLDTFDQKTETLVRQYASAHGIKKDDPDLINRIADCIRNALDYNLNLNWGDYDGDNMIVYMLTGDRKEGVCSHFATLGTMMYRVFGIPARYVIGMSGSTVANTTVELTADKLHSWVEIYLDGIGWVAMDVTGGVSSGGGSSGGGSSGGGSSGGGSTGGGSTDTPEDPRSEITIWTGSANMEFDGSALSCSDWRLTEGVLGAGHSICFDSSRGLPAQIYAGTIENALPLTIVDENGKDVGDQYNITWDYGTLTVEPRRLYVVTPSAEKVYDGTPLLACELTVTKGALLSGHTLEISACAQQIDAGQSDNVISVRITAEDGTDMTSNYRLVGNWGTLTVTRAVIHIVTASAQQVYDGSVLWAPAYTLTIGDTVLEGSGGVPLQLPTGDTIMLTMQSRIDTPGMISNRVTTILFSGREETDDASYTVYITCGMLTITPNPGGGNGSAPIEPSPPGDWEGPEE